MTVITLRDLEGLLRVKLKGNQTMTYTTKSLLATGENYGSTMLAVDVKITEEENESQPVEYHYVAKMSPPSEILKDLFRTSVTFKKERAFYTDILPLLQQFQREYGIEKVMDFFSRLEGSRLSLDPNSEEVDDDAVMLFGNLKYEGYQVVDRFKGFDLECAELLIKDLAVFHTVPMAFKLQKPKEFKEKIHKYIPSYFEFKVNEKFVSGVLDAVITVAEKDEKCAQYIQRIKKGFKVGEALYRSRSPPREPFATITHNDYWVNNTLIKFENGKPVKNVMVDFQILEYGSPGEDVIFFLYSSVTPKVLEENYDKLIRLYYGTFIDTLKQLQCDTNPFTFEAFQKELEVSAKTIQFFHLLILLIPIFTKKGAAKELSELREEDMVQSELAEEFPEKVCFVIKDFVKRGWL